MVTVFELKERIISCAVFDPEPSAHAMRRFLASEAGRMQFAALCGMIHFEYARRVFDWIPDEEWNELRELGRRHSASPRSVAAPFLQEMLTAMIAEKMTWESDRKSRDPFAFLRSLSDEKVRAIFSKEAASRIALVSVYWDPWDLKRILNLIPAPLSKEAVLHIARLEKLPQDALKTAAERYAQKLAYDYHRTLTPPPFRHQTDSAVLARHLSKRVPPPPPPIHVPPSRRAELREKSVVSGTSAIVSPPGHSGTMAPKIETIHLSGCPKETEFSNWIEELMEEPSPPPVTKQIGAA